MKVARKAQKLTMVLDDEVAYAVREHFVNRKTIRLTFQSGRYADVFVSNVEVNSRREIELTIFLRETDSQACQ